MHFDSDLEEAKKRKSDEYFFNIVAQELEQNKKHNPTWLKAISKSQGNTEKAKSYYIDFRVQSLKDDAILQQDIDNHKEAEKKENEEKQRKDNLYKKQKADEGQKGEKLHPIVTFILFSIIIIVLFRLLIGAG